MIGQGIQLNMVVSPRDRPTTFQYGDPACTRTVTDGNLDLPATLACLASKGEERSLQGQLLSAGECTLGVCSAGRIGNGCSSHSDCSILARAYTIPKSRKQADTFFPGFLADKVREQSCTP
jgi:hypothetical protein